VRQNGAVDQMLSTLGMPTRIEARFSSRLGRALEAALDRRLHDLAVPGFATLTSSISSPSAGIGRVS
jgi:hypothetical protein